MGPTARRPPHPTAATLPTAAKRHAQARACAAAFCLCQSARAGAQSPAALLSPFLLREVCERALRVEGVLSHAARQFGEPGAVYSVGRWAVWYADLYLHVCHCDADEALRFGALSNGWFDAFAGDPGEFKTVWSSSTQSQYPLQRSRRGAFRDMPPADKLEAAVPLGVGSWFVMGEEYKARFCVDEEWLRCELPDDELILVRHDGKLVTFVGERTSGPADTSKALITVFDDGDGDEADASGPHGSPGT
eukprot:m51a1_g4223 hypothetical protein (248) ;mRNA; r:98360-99333